jgi:signal transduction histidine kinase
VARRPFRLDSAQAVQALFAAGLVLLSAGLLIHARPVGPSEPVEAVLLAALLAAVVLSLMGRSRIGLSMGSAIAADLVVLLLMILGSGIDSSLFFLLIGVATWHGISLSGRPRLVSQAISVAGLAAVWTTDASAPVATAFAVTRFLALLGAMATASVLGDQMRRARLTAEQAAAQRGALVARVSEVRNSERRTLATGLHDGVVQGLTSSVFEVAAARRLVASGRGDEAVACLRRAEEEIEREVRALRSVMFDLWPVGLEDLGLAAALEESLDRFAAATGVVVHLCIEGDDRRLSPGAVGMLFRAHQEALQNVRRHAGAATVDTTLSVRSDRAHLTVRDDGVGLPGRPAAAGHIGLPSLAAWAQDAGGRLVVESSPGAGTTIDVEIPLSAAGADGPASPPPPAATIEAVPGALEAATVP